MIPWLRFVEKDTSPLTRWVCVRSWSRAAIKERTTLVEKPSKKKLATQESLLVFLTCARLMQRLPATSPAHSNLGDTVGRTSLNVANSAMVTRALWLSAATTSLKASACCRPPNCSQQFPACCPSSSLLRDSRRASDGRTLRLVPLMPPTCSTTSVIGFRHSFGISTRTTQPTTHAVICLVFAVVCGDPPQDIFEHTFDRAFLFHFSNHVLQKRVRVLSHYALHEVIPSLMIFRHLLADVGQGIFFVQAGEYSSPKSSFFARPGQTSECTIRHLHDLFVHFHCVMFSVGQRLHPDLVPLPNPALPLLLFRSVCRLLLRLHLSLLLVNLLLVFAPTSRAYLNCLSRSWNMLWYSDAVDLVTYVPLRSKRESSDKGLLRPYLLRSGDCQIVLPPACHTSISRASSWKDTHRLLATAALLLKCGGNGTSW